MYIHWLFSQNLFKQLHKKIKKKGNVVSGSRDGFIKIWNATSYIKVYELHDINYTYKLGKFLQKKDWTKLIYKHVSQILKIEIFIAFSEHFLLKLTRIVKNQTRHNKLN